RHCCKRTGTRLPFSTRMRFALNFSPQAFMTLCFRPAKFFQRDGVVQTSARADHATHLGNSASGVATRPSGRTVTPKLPVSAIFNARPHHPESRAASANALSMRFRYPDAMWSALRAHVTILG